MRKSIPTWRERLQGLDKPTDFAEAQAAKFEAADLRRYIAELEAASQPGEMGAGVRLSGVLTDEQRANAMAIYNSLPHNCQSADTVVTRISATAYANGWRDARNSAPVVAASAQQDEREADQDARFAIDGAIAFGRMGIKKPPEGHWLTEYWGIGQQLAELGKTSAWDNQTPVDASPSMNSLHKFLNAAAGEGVEFDGVVADELYIALFPQEYAKATASIDTGAALSREQSQGDAK